MGPLGHRRRNHPRHPLQGEDRLQGIGPRHLDVVTSNQSGACGFPFREGERYTEFGSKVRNREMSTNLCEATKRGGIHPAKFGLPRGTRK
ncbi:MAG: hypothetical protein ACRDH8_03715 [Actinomycetota bacterium]